MNFRGRALAVILFLSSFAVSLRAQTSVPAPRHITLAEAVQLALKHNHIVRIAGFQVQEKQHAKEVARSGYRYKRHHAVATAHAALHPSKAIE